MENKPEQKVKEIDLSNAFLTLSIFDFLDEVRKHRKEPVLRISVNLSAIEDKDKFAGFARRLKAFLENTGGQKRYATIQGKEEQISWEPNVFSSGVKFEKAD